MDEVVWEGGADGLRVTYRIGAHLLLVEAVAPEPRPVGGPLAKHLSIPLHPRDDGEFPDQSDIHLTYAPRRAGGRPVRVPLARIPFVDLDGLLLGLGQELSGVRLFKEVVTTTAPEELRRKVRLHYAAMILMQGASSLYSDRVASIVRPHVSPTFWGMLGLVARELGASLKEPVATWVREAPPFVIQKEKVIPGQSAEEG